MIVSQGKSHLIWYPDITVNFAFYYYPKFKKQNEGLDTHDMYGNIWFYPVDMSKQKKKKKLLQGKAALPEQWTDTSLLWCYAHHAVQRCSADAAMHDTLPSSSNALLWFHELSLSCFTSSISLYSFVTL